MKKENKDRNKMTKIGDFQVKQTFYLYPISLSHTHTDTQRNKNCHGVCPKKVYLVPCQSIYTYASKVRQEMTNYSFTDFAE